LNHLTALLIEWNDGQEYICPEHFGRLLGLAKMELGLRCDFGCPVVQTIDQLEAAIDEKLPRTNGKTLADVYGEFREFIREYKGVKDEDVRWDLPWTSLRTTGLRIPLLSQLGDAVSDCVEDLVLTYDLHADDPSELIGETVRSVWKKMGGFPFWEERPYERQWCPSFAIFRDVEQVPFVREHMARLGMDRLKPSTKLNELLTGNGEAALIGAVQDRFGVSIGKPDREKWWWVVVAAMLFSAPGIGLAYLLAWCIGFSGSASPIASFVFWGVGIAYAVYLYIASQPRLLPGLSTMKDVVRQILHAQRKDVRPRPRYRPISVQNS